jgi:hypothetical protein
MNISRIPVINQPIVIEVAVAPIISLKLQNYGRAIAF